MSFSSPGVRRFVSVLNFFADHPGQAFTLTDLVRALKLSRATCHGLLAGLVEAGYLYRTNDKTYLPGPALAAIGDVAKTHFSPLQAAQPEMRALADAFDATCSASFRETADIVVRERATAASHVGGFVPRGTRLPLLPEFAAPYFVRSDAAEIAGWLAERDPPATAEQGDALHRGIAFVREHGFLFGVRDGQGQDPGGDRLRRWMQPPHDAPRGVSPAFAIDPVARYRLVFVQAPVIDAQCNVAFVIGLQGFDGERSGADVAQIAERLGAACARVSSFMAHAPRR